MCSAPTSKEEKVRISASLVGAGRGNGSTAKSRNRTTEIRGHRGGFILHQVLGVAAFQLTYLCGRPFLPEEESN